MTVILDDSALRCPRCAKRMQVDVGQDDDETGAVRTVHSCPSCGYVAGPAEAFRPWSSAEVRRRIRIARHQLYGDPHPDEEVVDGSVVVPLRYDEGPFHTERVGSYLLTLWCQRCQQPGQSYMDCTCVLPPDRDARGFVRAGGGSR